MKLYTYNKLILLILFVFTNISCDNKSPDHIVHDVIIASDINKYEGVLISNSFRFPTKELFNSKLKEVFGIEISDFSNQSEFYILPKNSFSDESTFYPKAVVDKKYIYWNQEEGWLDLAFVNFNKYIFYNDKVAFDYLTQNDTNGYLDYIVQYYGFIGDSNLQTYIFKKLDGDLHSGYAYSVFFGRNGVNGSFELRKDMLAKYLKFKPDVQISISNFIENVIDDKKNDYMKIYEGDRNRDAAFVLNQILIQMHLKGETLISDWVDSTLQKYPAFLNLLKKNDSFGYEILQDYILNTYEKSN